MRTYHYHLMTTAVLVWIAASASTQAQDIHAEIKEWVIEPCMEVAAARGVGPWIRKALIWESGASTLRN